MSRRSGQSGTVVKQGNWFRVRFRLDIPGQYDRKQMNEKICPTSWAGKADQTSDREASPRNNCFLWVEL